MPNQKVRWNSTLRFCVHITRFWFKTTDNYFFYFVMHQLINLKLRNSFTSEVIWSVRACGVRHCFGKVYTESWENSLGLGTWQQVLKANEPSYSSHNWSDLEGSWLVRTCHCGIGHCLTKFFWSFMQAQMICEYVCMLHIQRNKAGFKQEEIRLPSST